MKTNIGPLTISVLTALATVIAVRSFWPGMDEDRRRPDRGSAGMIGAVSSGPWHKGRISIPRRPAAQGSREEPGARGGWELTRTADPLTGEIPAKMRRRELAFAATVPTVESRAFMRPTASGYSWSSRGPYNVGGRTRALAVDITDSDIILAGGVTGGMWRTSDAGNSWTRTTSYGQSPSVSCVTQDRRPGRTDVWYYGTGEPSTVTTPFDYSGSGIYRSTDGGRSWTPLESTIPEPYNAYDEDFDWVWSMATDPSNLTQDEVYAATFGGLMRSTDAGTSWTKVVDVRGTGDVRVTRDGVVYAVYTATDESSTLRRSVDGVNWIDITPQEWPELSHRWVLDVAPSNSSVVYLLGSTVESGFKAEGFSGSEWSGFWKYTYVSGDGTGNGGRWEDRSGFLPASKTEGGSFFGQSGYDLVVAVGPEDENIVFIGGAGLWRSSDGFATGARTAWIGGYSPSGDWEPYPGHHPDLHAVAFSHDDPKVLFTGSDGGVHRSDDGMGEFVNWIALNNGYRTAQFYTISLDRNRPGDDRLVGGTQDNGSVGIFSADPFGYWEEFTVGDGGYCAVAGLKNGIETYYTSFPFGEIYRLRTYENGEPISYGRVDPRGAESSLFITPFLLDPLNHDMMYLASSRHIWRNSALSSIPVGQGPATVGWSRLGNSAAGATITALGVSTAAPAHRLYYGAIDGNVYRIDGADQGDQARTLLTADIFPRAYVSSIAVDPVNGDRAVVFSNYNVQSLFLTTDAGGSWIAVGGNLEEHPDGTGSGPSCRWLSILSRPDGALYFLGTSSGLYSTTLLNGASTIWEREGAETIGNAIVEMIDLRHSDGRVVVATHGDGVYTATIPPSGVESGEKSGGEVAIESIDPNPASGRATVSYRVETGGRGRVEIRLYDPLGAEVRTLVERRLGSGRHQAIVDLTGLPAGTYLVRLTAGGRTSVRSLRVVR